MTDELTPAGFQRGHLGPRGERDLVSEGYLRAQTESARKRSGERECGRSWKEAVVSS